MYFIKSFILFEFIITILLFTVILTYSSNIILEINKKTIHKSKQLNSLLSLESTKLFLSKQQNILLNIKFTENKIFFDNHLLLDKVNNLNITSNNHIMTFYIELQNGIKQTWNIKYE